MFLPRIIQYDVDLKDPSEIFVKDTYNRTENLYLEPSSLGRVLVTHCLIRSPYQEHCQHLQTKPRATASKARRALMQPA